MKKQAILRRVIYDMHIVTKYRSDKSIISTGYIKFLNKNNMLKAYSFIRKLANENIELEIIKNESTVKEIINIEPNTYYMLNPDYDYIDTDGKFISFIDPDYI